MEAELSIKASMNIRTLSISLPPSTNEHTSFVLCFAAECTAQFSWNAISNLVVKWIFGSMDSRCFPLSVVVHYLASLALELVLCSGVSRPFAFFAEGAATPDYIL